MSIYNSRKYNHNSWNLWQNCTDELTLNNDDRINTKNATTNSFQLKKVPVKAGNSYRRTVDVMVPLKYLCNFWLSFKISLINCRSNLIS